MCLFRKRNPFEKNSKKYIEDRFAFLIDRGYECEYFNRGGEEEFVFAKEHTNLHKFSFEGLKDLTDKLAKDNVPVYFTIDLDCLDPSVFPGTGTPEAGGVNFMELLEAIKWVSNTNVVGADVNELAPMLDASGASTAVACKVLRELMLGILK